MVLGFVRAAYTNTVFGTGSSPCKALTIELKTVNFSAFTALAIVPVFGFDGGGRGAVKTVEGYGRGPVFVKEAFKEIAPMVCFVELGFNVGGVD